MKSACGRRMQIVFVVVVLAVITGAFSAPASAQLYDHKWSLKLGGEIATFSSTAQLDSQETGIGTKIDLEKDLGLDTRKNNFRFDGTYRFSRRSQVELAYSQRVRSNRHELDRDIEWGGVTYHAAALVKTRFTTNLLRGAWKYSVIDGDAVEGGFSLGVSTFWLSSRISGQGEVAGNTLQYHSRDKNVVAPIPVAGLFLDWAFTRQAVLRLSGDYFDASYNDRAGTLTDATAAIDVTPWPNVGLGLAYNWSSLEIFSDKRAAFKVDLTTEALFGYVRVVF